MANTSIHFVHPVFSDEPLPTLTWWRNEALIDDTYEVINNETTNILTINRVERKDLNSIFTCQALSQQLDIPVSTQVRLDLTCEYIIFGPRFGFSDYLCSGRVCATLLLELHSSKMWKIAFFFKET